MCKFIKATKTKPVCLNTSMDGVSCDMALCESYIESCLQGYWNVLTIIYINNNVKTFSGASSLVVHAMLSWSLMYLSHDDWICLVLPMKSGVSKAMIHTC